ncbi:hypothetical protein [Deferribacter desulfuricans]|uniref:hypothetical protein n=1 Tax=Deferribacter desulfuricans TaxID=197162 RepID=UPI00030C6664|nr:hypothetical protein [Deferribacter desulfuricans]
MSYDYQGKFLGLYYNTGILNENDPETIKKLIWHELLHLLRNDLDFENILKRAKLKEVPELDNVIHSSIFYKISNQILNLIQDAFINEDIGFDGLTYKGKKIKSIKFDNVINALEKMLDTKLPGMKKLFYVSNTVEIYRSIILTIIDKLLEMKKQQEEFEKKLEEFLNQLSESLEDFYNQHGTNGGQPDYSPSAPNDSGLTSSVSDLVQDILNIKKKDIVEKIKQQQKQQPNQQAGQKHSGKPGECENKQSTNQQQNNQNNNQNNSSNKEHVPGKKAIEDARAEAMSKKNQYNVKDLNELKQLLDKIAERLNKQQDAGLGEGDSFILNLPENDEITSVDEHLYRNYFYHVPKTGKGNTKAKIYEDDLDVSKISTKKTRHYGVVNERHKKQFAHPLFIVDTSGSFVKYVPFFIDLLNRLESLCKTEFTVVSFSGKAGLVGKRFNHDTGQYEYVFTDYNGGTEVKPIVEFLQNEYLKRKNPISFNQITIISDFDFADENTPEFMSDLIRTVKRINKKYGYTNNFKLLVITNNQTQVKKYLDDFNLELEDVDKLFNMWKKENNMNNTNNQNMNNQNQNMDM